MLVFMTTYSKIGKHIYIEKKTRNNKNEKKNHIDTYIHTKSVV